ncbi:hypothetical protein [Gloeothece verrucosa]|uniref:PRC-barrel domain-containing protein n=1 Tax=Gloeothece verrucosa (strain PCC 7822) TaxID=497965 RepID=E0U7V4_GLOV7|nr:hypothetical protein [Gloeothece verrucosa]ADN16041.1 conserved hypothetical protein [Gloeothece verrucosa PCC 7822]
MTDKKLEDTLAKIYTLDPVDGFKVGDLVYWGRRIGKVLKVGTKKIRIEFNTDLRREWVPIDDTLKLVDISPRFFGMNNLPDSD